ncbi:MAG: hypothetical protein ACKVP3_02700 [Hyphomicrobiaceae bacterium]
MEHEVERLRDQRRRAFGEILATGASGTVLRRLRDLGSARLRQMEDRLLEVHRIDEIRSYVRASSLAGTLAHVERIEREIKEARAARSREYRNRPRRRA